MKFGNDISQALCVSTIESPNRIEVLYRKTVKMGFRRIRSKNKTKQKMIIQKRTRNMQINIQSII